MPSLTVNICVFTLVLLSTQQLCDARPHSTSKREISKDYFHPLPVDHFEKSADGKYHLKKSAHRLDSEVKYATSEKNDVSPNDLKSPVIETAKDKIDVLKIEKEPLKAVETEKVDLEIDAPKPIPPLVEETKDIKDPLSLKSDIVVNEAEKKFEVNKEKAPFTPVDPKFVVPPKPDSKDEVKTHLPPTSEEEKVDEKVAIGQIPHMYPRLIPIPNTFRVPILIPIHKISYGAVSVVPIPPAGVSDRLPLPPVHDVSDRLPLSLEDDIVGEGGPESASIEEAAEIAAERKAERESYPVNPLPALLSFSGLLKDLKENSPKDSEKETKVVDVLGKKFLMQSNVMKYPNGDHGHTFIRFLSVKPLEKVEPKVMKEAGVDKSIEDETVEVKAKEAAAEFSPKNSEKEEEIEVKKEIETEAVKEPEILKAEETQIRYKIDPQVPKEITLKETVGVTLQKEGEDVGQAENVESVLNEEKMIEVKHSFVEEKIETGEKDTSSEVEKTVLKMKPDTEKEEIAYRVKMQDAEDKKKKLKGDEGVFSEEENSKELIITADSSVEKTVGEEIIEDSKREFFLPEKKKKELSKGEEKMKSKKSSKEKKSKKKCTCEEEEDSGTDYSSMESDDDY